MKYFGRKNTAGEMVTVESNSKDACSTTLEEITKKEFETFINKKMQESKLTEKTPEQLIEEKVLDMKKKGLI